MTRQPILTIFAVPKEFEGHIRIIQQNAIRSWALLPGVEILLLGDEPGVAAMAEEVGAVHIPDVECNEYGTPCLDSCFALAEARATAELLAYVNADIILVGDFVSAVKRVAKRSRKFLLGGQRTNLDLDSPLVFDDDWDRKLRLQADEAGNLFGAWAIDYFVFRRGLFGQIPPFAIGRWAWDNWLLYEAVRLGGTLIDATPSIQVIHQSHGYDHVGDDPVPSKQGPEALANLELAPVESHYYGLLHAAEILYPWGLCPALSPRRIGLRAQIWKTKYPNLTAPIRVIWRAWRRVFSG